MLKSIFLIFQTVILMIMITSCNKEIKLPIGSNVNLKTQGYEINTDSTNILATHNGMYFALPKNCFLDSAGNKVKGNVKVEIKSANSVKDLIKGGLTTFSNGNIIQTQGMFEISASSENKKIKLNPDIGLFAVCPKTTNGKGYRLYAGETINNELSNWKPLESFPTKIPTLIQELDTGIRKKCLKCQKIIKHKKMADLQNKKKIPKYEDLVAKKSKPKKSNSSAVKDKVSFYRSSNHQWGEADHFNRRYYWKKDSLKFYLSGEELFIGTKDQIRDCEELLKNNEEGKQIITQITDSMNVRNKKWGDFFTMHVRNLGWSNIDRLMKEENFVTHSGKIMDLDESPMESGTLQIIDLKNNVSITSSIKNGIFEFKLPQNSDLMLVFRDYDNFTITEVKGAQQELGSFKMSNMDEKAAEVLFEKYKGQLATINEKEGKPS